jgi:peptidoglycan/xylan/chitin deacetylase (PgdA/CDA1 family)
MVPLLQEERLSCLFFVTGKSVAAPYSLLWYIELYLMLTSAKKKSLTFSLPNGLMLAPLTTLAERRKAWLTLMRAMSRLDERVRRERMAAMAGELGLPADWKNRYVQDPVMRQRFCVMGVPELRQLVDAGMSVGAHSFSHPIPAEQADQAWREEMSSSRELLRQAIQQPVWAFAYPFGDAASVHERQYQIAEEEGFTCAFRNAGGPVQKLKSRFDLPRIHVSSEMNGSEFEAHISGFHDALRKRLGRA